MVNSRNSIAIEVSVAALAATTFVISTASQTAESTTQSDRAWPFEVDNEIFELIDQLDWNEPGELSIPPAVAATAELFIADRATIINLVISDALQNPDHQSSRDFYGTPGNRTAIVLTEGVTPWPGENTATVPGWNINERESLSQPESDAARVLVLRFDKFALDKPANTLLDGHVSLCLFNGGGNPDGTI